MYNRYELAFGEPAILQASHAMRTAPKRMTDGWVMDPKSIGSTRMTPYPAFQEVLVRNEPRGYVRALLAFGQDLGTKEAVKTAYQQLIAAHGENAVLEAARKMAAGRPSPTTKGDLDTLTSMLSSASSPERVESPVAAQVDYPQYLAWKGFGPGAKATYVFRGLQPTGRGANQMVPGQVDVRTTYTLQSITDEIAKLWLTEVVYDYPSGQAHPPRDTEIAYPAKIPPRQASAEAPATSGEQVLDIAGKKIATRWQAVRGPGRGCDNVVTIWTSEQVPGGLVRKTEDNNCQGRRIIRETILESFVASPVGTRAVVK